MKNREIVIISSDKGNRTVIMEKRKYNDLAENILKDETAYRKLDKDPTLEYQKENNEMVDTLYKKQLIDKKLKRKLIVENAIAPLSISFQRSTS